MEALETKAVYFDGISSRKRLVRLRLQADLVIEEDGVPIATWRMRTLRRQDSLAPEVRLSSTDAPELARISLTDEAFAKALLDHAATFPSAQAASGAGRIVGWSIAAIVSIALSVIYGVPMLAERLTPLVPLSFERRLGDMVDNQVKAIFGGKVCTDANGHAALDKLMDQLSRATGVADIQAEVLSSPTRNAIALPGGRVYLFDGLLQTSRSADEIAGVLAHELGHVRHRDGTRRLIQAGGSSFLIGLFFGDMTGSGAAVFATQQLLLASYSRETEALADEVAAEAMHKLGRSAKPMGDLLLRVTGQESKETSILASHPLSQDRLATLQRSDKGESGPPLLTGEDWASLRAICRKGD